MYQTRNWNVILSIYKELQTLNTRYPTDKWTTELKRKFSEEDLQINIQKKCSTSLATRTALMFPLTPVRIGSIKKTKKSKCWGNGEKDTRLHCRWVETGGATVEVSAEAPQKTKHRTALTQLSHSQEYTGRTVKSTDHGDICTPMPTAVYCSPRCPQAGERRNMVNTQWNFS